MKHGIELSTGAIKATYKLFDCLTESYLLEQGYTEEDVTALGELWSETKEIMELEQMGEFD